MAGAGEREGGGASMGRRSMRKDSIVMGLALFAMFFGAGNLIFPPTLGMDSGELWPLGLAGFLLTDVVLACLGIFAVNAAGGAVEAIEGSLGRRGGVLLSSVAVICLGALFAMPRTAATTYEMSIEPWWGAQVGLLPFSLAFFVVVYLLAFRESRIMDIIGKFFTPTLVVGVLLLVGAGIVAPLGVAGAPETPLVFQDGIRAGYQTMDVLGTIAFSLVLMDSIRAHGYTQRRRQLSIVAVACLLSVALLAVLYGGLTYLGATAQGVGSGLGQAQLIVAVTYGLLGEFGVVVLGVVVALACITTAVALVGSTAAYFQQLLGGRVPYRVLLAIDCAIGVLVCNFGLDNIVELADPVLGVVCPPLIAVIVALLFWRRIHRRGVYQGAALGAALGALAIELHMYGGLPLPVEWLPFYGEGFAWLPFAGLGAALGWLVGKAPPDLPGLRAEAEDPSALPSS